VHQGYMRAGAGRTRRNLRLSCVDSATNRCQLERPGQKAKQIRAVKSQLQRRVSEGRQ